MAKVIGFFPSAVRSRRRLSVLGLLLGGIGRGARRPAPLNPEEWSGHMLRDIGLSDQRGAGTPPSRQPWPPR
jgi:hypothetical protein